MPRQPRSSPEVTTCNGSTYFMRDYASPPALQDRHAASRTGRIDWRAQIEVD